MIRALDVSLNNNLQSLCIYLHQRGIPHKITEERGKQVIWVANHSDAELVRHYFQKWQTGSLESITTSSMQRKPGPMIRPRAKVPATLTVIVMSIIATGLIYLFPETLRWFTFTDLYLSHDWLSMHGRPVDGLAKLVAMTDILIDTLLDGQWWRLFTPVFLHFSILHIAFNLAMFLFFGQRIELIHGVRKFLCLMVFVALISNLTQYFSGNLISIFGGLSGIIYGFIGFCWIRARERPDGYGIPKGIYIFMIVWLLLGYAGVLGHLGLGLIANGAHAGGFIAGMVAGLITAKKKQVGSR